MKPLLCSALLLLTFSLSAQAPVAVPIPKEPHHHLVLENEYVRVFPRKRPAHESTLLHQHDVPISTSRSVRPTSSTPSKANARSAWSWPTARFGYSRGGFAHIARTDAGLVFNNVTIDFCIPGRAAKSCERITDGPLNGLSEFRPRLRFRRTPRSEFFARATGPKKLFETEEVFISSHLAPIEQRYSESGPQAARLLVVEDNPI